jgi:hypothetical protein
MYPIMNNSVPFAIEYAEGPAVPPIFVEATICKPRHLCPDILNCGNDAKIQKQKGHTKHLLTNVKNQEMGKHHTGHCGTPALQKPQLRTHLLQCIVRISHMQLNEARQKLVQVRGFAAIVSNCGSDCRKMRNVK